MRLCHGVLTFGGGWGLSTDGLVVISKSLRERCHPQYGICSRVCMGEVIAGFCSKPYRRMQDFLVEPIQQAVSWFVRQRRRNVLSVQRGSRKGQGSGIKRVPEVYVHIPFQLSTQLSELRTLIPQVPVVSRTESAPHWFSCASFRESSHGRC